MSATIQFGRGPLPAPVLEPGPEALAAHAALPADVAARVDPALLGASTGNESVGAGVSRSVRIMLEGDGAPSQRRFVAASQTAQRLLASSAGPKLERILRGYLASADAMAGATELRGITLAPDLDSVRASEVLHTWQRTLDRTEPDGHVRLRADDQASADALVTGLADRIVGNDPRIAGAWTQDGWITFLPKAAHVLLAAANANTIDLSDRPDGKPGLLERTADWARDIGTHEVQHAVSPTDGRNRVEVWEEATAEVLARGLSQRQAERTGLTAESLRAELERADEFDPGWTAYVEPPAKDADPERERRRREVYEWPHAAMVGLLALAGIDDVSSSDGWQHANELLQAPGEASAQQRVTDAIVTRNGIAPDDARRAGELVRGALVFDGGADALEQLHALAATS